MRKSVLTLVRILLCGVFLAGTAQVVDAADGSVTVISRVYAAPGREAEMEVRLLKLVAFVRKAEPNVIYRLYRSKKDQTVFTLYEVYPSPPVVQEHLKVTLPAFGKEVGPAPEGLYARPTEFEVFSALTD